MTAQTALITGASSGLGVEFARLFARDGVNVVLVARRQDRLEALARELSEKHGVHARVHAADLQKSNEVARLCETLERDNVQVDFLVNNAGYGNLARFGSSDEATELGMVRLNIEAVVALTHRLVPGMLARKRGRILNLGSTAGFQPGPFMAVYYASKAFVNSFTESLSHELNGSGVTATVSCPGPTQTEFGKVAGNQKSKLFQMAVMGAPKVAEEAYRAMMKGRPMVVHGARNRSAVGLARFAPRPWLRSMMATLNQPG